MIATELEVFATYQGDGRGFPQGDPLGCYPFAAAANASEEIIRQRGYGVVRGGKAAQFFDDIYLFKDKFPIDRLVGYMAMGAPHQIVKNYDYSDGFDRSKFVLKEGIVAYLEEVEKGSLSLVWAICDEKNLYVLSHEKPIEMTKFTKSREMAIAHALDKLTKEEQKLLGLK
jgi:hypothetical protein